MYKVFNFSVQPKNHFLGFHLTILDAKLREIFARKLRLFCKEFAVGGAAEVAEVDFFLADVAFVRKAACENEIRHGGGGGRGDDLDGRPVFAEKIAVTDSL